MGSGWVLGGSWVGCLSDRVCFADRLGMVSGGLGEVFVKFGWSFGGVLGASKIRCSGFRPGI